MNLNLKGKFALVTGSSNGIGFSIAKSLIGEGCNVILNGRDCKKLEAASRELEINLFVSCDISKQEGIGVLINFLKDKNINLDILVCNVGSGKSAPPGEENLSDWKEALDINLISTALLTNTLSSMLIKTGGSIVAISSICGHGALGAPLTYSAAKAALNSYLRGLARILGPKGVRVNGVSPGNILFNGSVWDRKLKKEKEEVEIMLEKEIALQKLGTPEEIANTVCFLVSDKASFITGEIIVVDGGQLRG